VNTTDIEEVSMVIGEMEEKQIDTHRIAHWMGELWAKAG
jgi:hypothetical protein